jgi:O-6-methylguanine DNA methyltransferase
MTDRAALRTSMAGPWGPFLIAATTRGVVAIEWLTTADAFETSLSRRLGSPIADASQAESHDPRQAHLHAAVAALEALLAGHPPGRLPAFDLADRPAWDRDVLAAVARIPWGRTASYGEIARQIGAPRAARAVGGAVGRNPVSLLIPCHRVIAADGSIGGYGGDAWGSREDRLAIKRELLLREGVAVAPTGD